MRRDPVRFSCPAARHPRVGHLWATGGRKDPPTTGLTAQVPIPNRLQGSNGWCLVDGFPVPGVQWQVGHLWKWEMGRVRRKASVLLFAGSLLALAPGVGEATVPGAIGHIVYVSTADNGNGEIYVRDYAGSSPVRLTFNTEHEFHPRWSPDGRLIAFTSLDGDYDVHVMNADGSNSINLTNDISYDDIFQDWSPDGTRILFSSDRGGTDDLWTMSSDGTGLEQLTYSTGTEETASWSPDGSAIAFARSDSGDYDIWVVNADGSNERNVIDRIGSDVAPVWSPEGTQIAFSSMSIAGTDVWVADAGGSNRINLTNDPASTNSSPAWSPDGSKIGFESTRGGSGYDLWTMNRDGSNPAHLTDHPANELWVDWESVNRDPIAVDDEARILRGESVVVDVLANDSDPDGETLEVADVAVMPVVGNVAVDPSGTITYTHDGSPPLSSSGYPYGISFEYEIRDTRMGTARAEVTVWITGEQAAGFDDVPAGHLFYGDVMWLASQGITRGCNPPDNTLFCPDQPVTRGQMAAFLVRMNGYTGAGPGDWFVDDDGSVFEIDIDRLATAGVTRGCNPPLNNRFCPGEPVTRDQMAAFLVRAFGLGPPAAADLFVDDDGSVFEADIDALGAAGVTRGCNPPLNDRFCPYDVVTRAQMAAFLHRIGE